MNEADIILAENGDLRVIGELSFHTVPGLFEKARGISDPGSDLVFDLSGVTRANSAGLVLLLEWLSNARREQRKVSFKSIPESLRNIASVSNVMHLLSRARADLGAPVVPKKSPQGRRKKRKARGRH